MKMRRMRVRWVLAGVATILAGCSSSSSSGGGGDGGSSSGGDSGGSFGVDCSPVTNVGPTVPATQVAGALPTMTGGTIVEGTYVETGYAYYNGASGSGTHKETLIFANGTVKNINSDTGKPDVILAGTYTTSGNTLTMNIQCPQAGTVTTTFTASATTLMFIVSTSPNKLETWTKQ
jgi:hypothetical protein